MRSRRESTFTFAAEILYSLLTPVLKTTEGLLAS